MIRPMQEADMDQVMDVWLKASFHGHSFIKESYWTSQAQAMREEYLPASKTWVCERGESVVGFCSVVNDTLAALFVRPDCHGLGIGSRLLEKAVAGHDQLRLTVYSENESACAFYLRRGFKVVGEQVDPRTGHEELVMEYRSVSI